MKINLRNQICVDVLFTKAELSESLFEEMFKEKVWKEMKETKVEEQDRHSI